MKRKVGQDMVIKKKSSLATKPVLRAREITKKQPVPSVRAARSESPSPRPKADPVFSEVFSPHYFHEPRRPARGGILWLFASAAIIGLAVTVLSLITHATIDVRLQQKTYTIDATTNLYTEPTDGQVMFKTAKVVDKQSIVVPTDNKQSVSVSATGIVQLFSNNTKPVTVPAGTKMVSTTKKTFVTKSKVIIPAGTTKNPGSAKVAITATVPGVESNIKLDDLQLPTFPQVIARTITEVGGGISGEQFILNDAELATAKTTLQGQITLSNPAAFLSNQIPDNFILPESLLQVSDIVYSTESVVNGVLVTAQRTITGNMIDRENLQQFLVSKIPETDRMFMYIFNDKEIIFTPASLTSSSTASSENIILPVHISGLFTARAEFSESDILKKIAHTKKAVATQTLQTVPGVISAQIHMWPPWVGRVPNKVSAITFKTTYEIGL